MTTTLQAQKRAAQLLHDLRLDTIPVPVERIAKALGAQVRFTAFEGDLSGLIYREEDEGGRPLSTIIGVNSTHAPTRRRFTLAHEIGHLYLGHLEGESLGHLHIDRKFHWSQVPKKAIPRDARSSLGVDAQEMAANAFAAALLMPEKTLREDFETLRDGSIGGLDFEDDELARALADRYKVSPQAMLLRLFHLRLISDPFGGEV